MPPRWSQEVSLPWSPGSSGWRLRICMDPVLLFLSHAGVVLVCSPWVRAAACWCQQGLWGVDGAPWSSQTLHSCFGGVPFLPSYEASAGQSSLAVSLHFICASVSLPARTEPSSGCWNAAAQPSWPGRFSNCSYGAALRLSSCQLPSLGTSAATPGAQARGWRGSWAWPSTTHVWHSSIFGSSGAALA